MKPFDRILVATDFSPSADRALEEAMSLAAALRSELRLVHIDSRIPPLGGEPGRDHSRRTHAERKLERRLLRAWKRGITAAPILEAGIAEDQIVKVAEHECADWIIMGAQGWSMKMVPGEVALRVAARAPCPVLIVRVSQSGAMRKAC